MAGYSPSSAASATHPGGVRVLLAWLGGWLKLLLLMLLLGVGLLQLLTPSLSYKSTRLSETYSNEMPTRWAELVSSNGKAYHSRQVHLLTADNRELVIDYLVSQRGVSTNGQALTIIAAPFMTPDWVLTRAAPQNEGIVVIYRSPRQQRASGPNWPSGEQLESAKKLADYWNIFATNPLNRLYNLYMLPHEAPGDILDIIIWAQKNMGIDTSRINLVGLGSGSLVAAAAAHQLQVRGLPVHALALVYPPADLTSALKDNLIRQPRWLREVTAPLLSLLYSRLHLQRHLSKLVNTPTLLIIPQNSYDLATYAAEPAIALAGPQAVSRTLDTAYTSYFDVALGNRVRQLVISWLRQHRSFGAY